MIIRNELETEQVKYAIDNGEFDADVIHSKDNVVIIMTQDWCPQWHDMSSWIYDLEVPIDIAIYELEYNKSDLFNDFMNLKETKWKNDHIPYLRYYKNGKPYKETNYISKTKFKDIISV